MVRDAQMTESNDVNYGQYWWLGVVVASFVAWTKLLLYVEPG